MKKLFNGKFLFILASSLIVLILLIIGAFYLFDDSDAMFMKSGYILNPLSSTSEKYFFNENTDYKENLLSMVEFNDVDKKNVTVLKDSFIHYIDESIAFLSDGAILDLDSIHGKEAVDFYNISNKSIIEKKNTGYVITNKNGDIKLNNFMGRISDSKYIVVGDLNLQIPGNEKTISGNYFEIVYVEEGIVNIENKNVKYQVMAEGTKITVNNELIISLGDKKISSKDEDIMSITSITISGDENIEIIPKPKEEEPDEDNKNPSGNSSGNASGNNNPSGPSSSSASGTGKDDDNTEKEKNDSVIVSLKKAIIGSTNVDVTFDIDNATEEDTFMLQVINLNTGRTIDMTAAVVKDEEIKVNLLSPSTKYLFTVINNRDGGKYYQKIFETSSFGIKLEKSYTTSNSIAYKVTIDEETDITNAKLSLYKYNEETKKNEIVTNEYYDTETGEIKNISKVTNINKLGENINGTYEIVYDGLESDTIYTAVLDEFSVLSSNFKDIYNVTLTSMTLKEAPAFTNMTVNKNLAEGKFKLSLDDITDKNNAITSYTYIVYELATDKQAIDPITKTNASPITLTIGNNDNELKNDTNYYYRVVIEYFDNEKYIEYVTSDSLSFSMGSEPYITVVPNDDYISFDKIRATIYLTDNSCFISMPGREKCVGTNTTVVEVNKINAITGEKTKVFNSLVDFEITGNQIKYDLMLDGLQAGTTYSIDVKAIYNTNTDNKQTILLHTDESKKNITTKTLSSFIADWIDKGSSASHVINLQNKFIAEDGTGTLSGEETASSIEKVVIKLYEGSDIENLQEVNPIASTELVNTDEFNIKENFYDNGYVITNEGTFGIDIDGLKKISTGEKLNQYYTVAVYAYYDYEMQNEVLLTNNVTSYKISPILLMENIVDPTIELLPINNKASGNLFKNLNDNGTTVGYLVTAAFDSKNLISNRLIPSKIRFYVYDSNKEKVSFYVTNEKNELELVTSYEEKLQISNDNTSTSYFDKKIYMDYGIDYLDSKKVMTRGNTYYIGYEIELMANNQIVLYPSLDDDDAPSDYGIFKTGLAMKENPLVKMYIAKSTENSITYRYDINDPDKAIYKESLDGEYGLYYSTASDNENKINLIKNSDKNNQFNGDATLSGLSNGVVYSLYYKRNISNTGDIETDVVKYLGEEVEGIIFDGYYDLNKEANTYNFKYQIINNSLSDNKVTVKILANEEILRRILSYKVTFSADDSKIEKDIWQLSSCNEDDTIGRCFFVDYSELKDAGMKNKNIIVKIEAIYDNGLSGFDYKIKKNETDTYDYEYVILQNNNTAEEYGSYLSFSTKGQLTSWSSDLNTPKGYYYYSLNDIFFYYQSKVNTYNTNFTVSLSPNGYVSTNGTVTPKMVSTGSMKTDNDTFSFNSITPKVTVNEISTMLNGTVSNISLTGVDLEDIKNEGTLSEPEYYLYIDVWNKEDEIGNISKIARPTLKIKIDNEDRYKILEAVIDGLNNNTKYFYNIYAYMHKNNSFVYTQLFDASYSDKYQAKTYNFTTLSTSKVYRSFAVSHEASKKIYGDRSIKTQINLSAEGYKARSFNFDLTYVLCDMASAQDGTCYEKNIFKKTISADKIDKMSITDYEDILAEYNIEFNKNYYMYIYAEVKIYTLKDDTYILEDKTIQLNAQANVKLRELVEPSFMVTRNAIIEDGKYAIEFNINVNDPDRTLVDGQYFARLVNSSGTVVGTMEVKNNSGVYEIVGDSTKYLTYALDGFVVNKSIRMTGLEEDEKYIFTVYNDAYLNNYTVETDLAQYTGTDEEKLLAQKEDRTYQVKKSHTVYSANTYGVAFGRDLLYSATAKSIIVTFLGGSNFSNVRSLDYTIGLWDSEDGSTYNGTYDLTNGNKKFELYANTEDWRFVIDPQEMRNVLGQTYTVALRFRVVNPKDEKDYHDYDFEGRTQYVEDEGK